MAAGRTEVSKAVAEAAGQAATVSRGRRGRTPEVLGAEVRRRDVVPLLVLHFVSGSESYGNELIHEIEQLTEGAISVNPNTMYPLLRELEEAGLLAGRWEHPEKRTRRYYAITAAGKREYERLRGEVGPYLDRQMRSLGLIKQELYGD